MALSPVSACLIATRVRNLDAWRRLSRRMDGESNEQLWCRFTGMTSPLHYGHYNSKTSTAPSILLFDGGVRTRALCCYEVLVAMEHTLLDSRYRHRPDSRFCPWFPVDQCPVPRSPRTGLSKFGLVRLPRKNGNPLLKWLGSSHPSPRQFRSSF